MGWVRAKILEESARRKALDTVSPARWLFTPGAERSGPVDASRRANQGYTKISRLTTSSARLRPELRVETLVAADVGARRRQNDHGRHTGYGRSHGRRATSRKTNLGSGERVGQGGGHVEAAATGASGAGFRYTVEARLDITAPTSGRRARLRATGTLRLVMSSSDALVRRLLGCMGAWSDRKGYNAVARGDDRQLKRHGWLRRTVFGRRASSIPRQPVRLIDDGTEYHGRERLVPTRGHALVVSGRSGSTRSGLAIAGQCVSREPPFV